MKLPVLITLISLITSSCDNNSGLDIRKQKSQQELVNRSIENMVSVKGGNFRMGDFGPLVGDELPLTTEPDNKVLHDVTLSDFSISKYKVTWRDYDIYAKIKHLDKPEVPYGYKDHKDKVQTADMPAALNWQQARDYCQWLGKSANKEMDLPTEAQWEYAARDGGKFVIYATDNGKFERGRNLASVEQGVEMSGMRSMNYPVGKFPPTPLRLYDMAGNGVDWMIDWYAPDYYAKSTKKNPQGPVKGEKKVVRGFQNGGGAFANQTVFRQSRKPDVGKSGVLIPYYNARCVINH
ncbi:formylglycine-generating enzyme family protein [Winslowiella iniecta]|uniref:Sulfatase-modifying factor enzyme-like domain-containing protein n=1 Tax=Winslowiella iniecta TaxID=1560201 RepID=A0A0L7SZP4_9GAMM|nr:SUMF1/EgtB/PvdO family nonheme iron enzyme [Winslowiella iniecta]KOC87873.1 hypothetical protein NG43_21040 [Winslowiella iniecta]KOC88535.1 hypothetical protein NG42_15860 [Winslowiella iniecta]